jgi:hypothetical protein
MNFVVADTDDQALGLLHTGKVQAVFTLGGWPLPAVSRHRLDSGLQLVDFDLTLQPPYLTVKRNYQNLDAFNLNFLGVPNLLVTRPFKPGGAMGSRSIGHRRQRRLIAGGFVSSRAGRRSGPDRVYGVRRFAIGPSPGIARDKGRKVSSAAR